MYLPGDLRLARAIQADFLATMGIPAGALILAASRHIPLPDLEMSSLTRRAS